MQIHIYCERPALWDRFGTTAEGLATALRRVAEGTETRDLVVTVHLTARGQGWGGRALAHRWVTPAGFASPRWPPCGQKRFGRPAGLPARFKLIRLHCGGEGPPYPAEHTSRYLFTWRFDTFTDHLAHLFAHELHHFRRYHLGLHPGEGEASAERWAHARLRELGMGSSLAGRRRRRPRGTRHPLPAAFRVAHERLRAVTPGATLVCATRAGRLIRAGETVRVVRPPRRGAWRMAVRAADGRCYLVPLTFLRVP
jgi:hypothetical protein